MSSSKGNKGQFWKISKFLQSILVTYISLKHMILVPHGYLKKKQIPTKRDVLARMLSLTKLEKKTLSAAAFIVAEEVIDIWCRNRKDVIVQSRKNIITKLKSLHEAYFKAIRNPSRETKSEVDKKQAFEKRIEEEFEISLGKRRPRVKKATNLSVESDFEDNGSAENEGDDDEHDDLEYEPPTKSRKQKRKITRELVASLDHAGMSSNKAASVILTTAHYLNIVPQNVPVSRATIHRQRRSMRSQINKEIKNDFCQNLNDAFFILHWDGKILAKWRSVDGKSDKLAIVLSNGGSTKILGISDLSRGTAEEQFLAIEKTIEQWKVTSFIKGICFDTTSVNTGKRSGTCEKLREKFNGKILTLACRHHVLELVLSRTYTVAMNDKSQSPDIALFVRFKSHWKKLENSKVESGMLDSRVSSCFGEELRVQLINLVHHQLSIQNKTRKDYVEFLELALIFLNETSYKGKQIKIRSPGALHRARFMARAIYCLKIFAFRSQFKLSGKLKTYVSPSV